MCVFSSWFGTHRIEFREIEQKIETIKYIYIYWLLFIIIFVNTNVVFEIIYINHHQQTITTGGIEAKKERKTKELNMVCFLFFILVLFVFTIHTY